MNELTDSLDLTTEHTAVTKAWEQVIPEELAKALRAVPAKIRGRMLSRLKTPSSKLTSLTARMLVTNLGRGTHLDRYRAGETITGPVIKTLGEITDEAVDLGEIIDAVAEEAAKWGPSIVVVAAVCGLVNETERFAPVIVACRDAGFLGPELTGMADNLADAAAAHLAGNAGTAVSDEPGEVSDEEPLEKAWEKAVAAAGRISDEVGAGRLPGEADLALVTHYAALLTDKADRFSVEATLAAVSAAATRAEADAATEALASRLRRLAGPPNVAFALSDLYAAVDQLPSDRVLAERLGRFVDVVSGSDNTVRLALAGELRGQPAPPSQELLDAAMLGMLHFADEDRPAGSQPAGGRSDTDGEDTTATAGPARQESLLDVQAASAPGTLFRGHPDVDSGPAEPETPPIDRTASTPLGDAGLERPERPGPAGDEATPADADSPPSESAANGGEVEVAEPAPTGAVAGPAELIGDEDDYSGPEEEESETPTGEECAQTLARLVAGRRFSLAHHLSQAIGQDLRAAVLSEAALAEGVRRSGSPAATDLVEQALSVHVPADDRGSLALRTASAARVALLDPSSGAAEVLRSLVDSLGPMPALRAFAVAVMDASVHNVTLASAGNAGDAGRARDQAAVIATWAADTLARPRHNLPYTGTELWKALVDADEPFGQILGLMSANDTGGADRVRDLSRRLSSPKELEKAVLAADTALQGGKPRGTQTIMGGAKQSLIKALREVIEQALAWSDAVRLTSPTGRGVQRVQREAWELRQRLDGELDGSSFDEVTAAFLAAAAASLAETISLFGDVTLAGEELEPDAALNRSLILVDGLSFDDAGVPRRAPNVAELVKAASESRAEAFSYRLAVNDFPTAEAIIDLPAWDGKPFDEAAAMKTLRSREREAAAAMRERWAELDGRYAAARARGRISDADAAVLGASLEQANPAPDEDVPRRDLGQVAVEIEALAAELDSAAERHRQAVRADVEDAVASEELNPAWAARLLELLAGDELGAAEEYLHRARAGEKNPEDASTLHEPEGQLGAILAANPDGVTAETVELVRSGGQRGILDFSHLDDADRASVADALDAWVRLRCDERPANLDEPLSKVLRLLGIIPRSVNRPPELRAASTASYWFVDVDGEVSGYAYVPDYGSRSIGRRRFMLCWDEDLPAAQLWTQARTKATDDRPVYVLYFGTLTPKARLDLARHARSVNGQGVAVIDSTVILRCASAGRQSYYDATMRAVLPYAAPNPYDPNLLAGMPTEMFYGRRVERDSVKSLTGTSIISGGRRLGKSALLRSAQQELARDNPDVTVELIVIQDVAAPPRNDPGELWPRLAGRLAEAKVLAANVAGTADGVCSGIRSWLSTNPHKRLLLMLDESDFFLRADANTGFANVVRLRDTMVDGDGRFKVVFSGLQHVARYRRLPNQPLSHFAAPRVIGPLDPAAASELVRRPLHAIGWSISDPQVDRIVTYCACNPSVIQLACASLLSRLYRQDVSELAPWTVADPVIDELLRSPEVAQGVRDRLFLTLELDHRYKLLAYLLAWRANTHGLGPALPPGELRRLAAEWWPDGFSTQRTDDVRALCDELVGLGVFAGDAETGYRMLSPGTVRLFGDVDEITEELLSANESYEKDRSVGAAGSRMRLTAVANDRFSPLTAVQLADVIGAGSTQLRVVVGSRATRVDAVTQALVAATTRLPESYASVTEVNSLRAWRDSIRAPATWHLVVVSDLTFRVSEASWDQSIESARRRGSTRTGRGTRAAVLVAGPDQRWLLRRLVDRPDGQPGGDLVDVTVGLRRVDAVALQAWDHIEELDIGSPARQRKLLEVTGGWPFLVERALSQRPARGIDRSLADLAAYLATAEGAAELVAAAGLDPGDPDQPAGAGLVAVFDRLVETGWREGLADLAALLQIDEALRDEDDPAEAVAILALLGVLAESEDGTFGAEPVLSACWNLHRPAFGV